MKFVLFSLFFVTIFVRIESDDTDLCKGRKAISQPVIDYCDNHNGTMRFRCCVHTDPDDPSSIFITAVDFIDLNYTSIPNLTYHVNLIPNVIDFRLNEHIVQHPDDFLGSNNIGTLYLPTHYSCPGGESVWNITKNVTDPLGNFCSGLKDFCETTSHICTEPHSVCSVNGPNHTLCSCEKNYHGYKCLRKGVFPKAAFLGSTLGVTTVATALLYWITRRNVRKRHD